ncbi:hypothetical protein [Microbacterium xanthum]|uniref:hypothetical protein n=1 Tax=Microbacterium xanthum TaxID=3079794 RepID=UPI002AD2F93F|nr:MULTISPECIES: hypothetical protein [unclassified Microbacterium]MDZ8172607.1 hypothetical protein [Microbacterium sp. KSW-48]MDZ8202556.1 hypothetical protein [Microbacterium sp. SSW1-59]
MARGNGSESDRPRHAGLRARVRAAGGWYAYVNARLIAVAGPASVGPYETTPEPPRHERPCPVCGAVMTDHRVDRSGPKPLLRCPPRG